MTEGTVVRLERDSRLRRRNGNARRPAGDLSLLTCLVNGAFPMNTISSRSLARRSVLAAAIFMAGSAALLTAACSNGQAAAGSASPVSPTPAAASPSAAPATSTPAAAASSAGVVPANGCPVSADTLLTALERGSSDMYRRVGSPTNLTEIACYQNYATGWTPLGGHREGQSSSATTSVREHGSR